MLKEALKTERLVIKPPEIDDKVELTQLINDYDDPMLKKSKNKHLLELQRHTKSILSFIKNRSVAPTKFCVRISKQRKVQN